MRTDFREIYSPKTNLDNFPFPIYQSVLNEGVLLCRYDFFNQIDLTNYNKWCMFSKLIFEGRKYVEHKTVDDLEVNSEEQLTKIVHYFLELIKANCDGRVYK